MRKRDLYRLSFIISLAALLMAGATVIGPPSASAQDQILPLKIKIGDKAPDFSLPNADGKPVRLSDFAGHNVLIDIYRGYW